MNALYYRLTGEPVAQIICIDDRVNVDVDARGRAVGIEVLDPPGFSSSVAVAAPVKPPCPLHPELTGTFYAGDPVCTCDPPLPQMGISVTTGGAPC